MSFSCQYLCTNMWDVSCARPVAASRKWFDGEYPTCCVWFSYYFMLVRYKVVAAVWCPTQTCEAGEVCSWRVLLHLPHKHAKHSSSSSSSASSCTNVCVSACSVCIWNGRSPFLGHEKLWSFNATKTCETRMSSQPPVNIQPESTALSVTATRLVYVTVCSTRPRFHKKAIADRVPVSSSVPLWVSGN